MNKHVSCGITFINSLKYNKFIKGSEIIESQNFPLRLTVFEKKIFPNLRTKKLIEGRRNWGMQLLKRHQDISIAEIMKALESSLEEVPAILEQNTDNPIQQKMHESLEKINILVWNIANTHALSGNAANPFIKIENQNIQIPKNKFLLPSQLMYKLMFLSTLSKSGERVQLKDVMSVSGKSTGYWDSLSPEIRKKNLVDSTTGVNGGFHHTIKNETNLGQIIKMISTQNERDSVIDFIAKQLTEINFPFENNQQEKKGWDFAKNSITTGIANMFRPYKT